MVYQDSDYIVLSPKNGRLMITIKKDLKLTTGAANHMYTNNSRPWYENESRITFCCFVKYDNEL